MRSMDNSSHSRTSSPLIRHWIMLCAVLVLLMVIIGGLTRLTESGLSIVEWKLVTGIFPPVTEAGWEAELQEYRSSPQYQQINKGMSIAEFKSIYWLEYLHRLLGRVVGIAFIIPLIFFAATKRITRCNLFRMIAITALVGLQGFIGWYMVSSGLNNVPSVSPYRLALHLGGATIIFGLLVKMWYRLGSYVARDYASKLPLIILGVIFLQILLGALVAGLDAGLTYNTFPLMDGDIVPSGLFLLEPLHLNFFENVTMVQFQHRSFAYVVVALVTFQHIRLLRHSTNRAAIRASWQLTGLTYLQAIVGIATLMYVVPISLASIHQTIAILLIGLCVRLHHLLHWRTEEDSSSYSHKEHHVCA